MQTQKVHLYYFILKVKLYYILKIKSGIMQLITNCEPKNVVLVHGEGGKMDFLKNQIIKEFSL
jgi:hypothetical protein